MAMALSPCENPPELWLGDENAPTAVDPGAADGPGSPDTPAGLTGIFGIFGNCPWAAATTRPNYEKRVVERFRQAGIHYFLPYVLSPQKNSANRVYRPLFPGVVFFRADPAPPLPDYFTHITPTELSARTTNAVFSVVRTGAQVQFRRELSFFLGKTPAQRREDVLWGTRNPHSPASSPIKPGDLQPGYPVIIADGPLAGTHGTVTTPPEAHASRIRVAVRLQTLGMALIRVDASRLRSANAA